LLNVLDIMRQIAKGHSRPWESSSGPQASQWYAPYRFPDIITVVLYHEQDKSWKITDFGLTTEGTSRRLITSAFSHGTAGYRAPELVKDERNFNNKSDIWALGCILYELVTDKKPFLSDWALLEYTAKGNNDINTMVGNNMFVIGKWRDWITEYIEVMLSVQPSRRPAARQLHEAFSNGHDSLLAEETGGTVHIRYKGKQTTRTNDVDSQIPSQTRRIINSVG
jgi:serine/threonine protein kinase